MCGSRKFDKKLLIFIHYFAGWCSLSCVTLRSFFRSGQRSGHQMSAKVKFCHFNIFFRNYRRTTREPIELQRREKAQSIALLTLFRQHVLRFDLRSTGRAECFPGSAVTHPSEWHGMRLWQMHTSAARV